MFFMKIMMSLGTTTLPLASVPTVMSSALIVWRVERATMSAYCDERTLLASLMIFWSSATARFSAAA